MKNRADALALIVKISREIGNANDWEPEAIQLMKSWFRGVAEGTNK
jgi:hypothetical protein